MSNSETAVVYDGQCPFCSRYIKLLRLREAVGAVRLIDAREGGPYVGQVVAQGYDLDEGMVLVLGGQVYYGAECIHRLALMTTSSSLFNRINGIVFRSRTASRTIYPVLKLGRNAILRLLGRSKLDLSPALDDRPSKT